MNTILTGHLSGWSMPLRGSVGGGELSLLPQLSLTQCAGAFCGNELGRHFMINNGLKFRPKPG